MKEELLHLVWKLKRFNLHNLQTINGETIKIINFGNHNHNAGPDFLNATIKIGNQTWVGHVEMHTLASEWTAHKHQFDPAYNNVILHVVYENNAIVKTQNGNQMPTLILKDRIEKSLIYDYQRLLLNPDWIPCAQQLHKANTFKINMFLEGLLIERLEAKCQPIINYLKISKNNWEYVCYKMILKYFGLKVNKEAFETLSEKLPHSLLIKYHLRLIQCEAILLGQAGLLHSPNDNYTQKLKKEYDFMRKKHNLQPMVGVEWRFARMRPSNFPTLRIVQVAALYHKTPKIFNQIVANPTLKEFEEILTITLSKYWNQHYIPGKPSKNRIKKLGKQAIKLIIINAFIPLLFTYGISKGNQKIKDLAIDLYRQLPKEKNVIIENWKKLGLNIESAAETQALIQLKMQYCNKYKCLSCQIGQDILFK